MPNTFTGTVSGLLRVDFTIDGGTKPAGTDHYQIERKDNGAAASEYQVVMRTKNPTPTHWPVARATDDTQLSYDFRCKAYITASLAYDAGLTSIGYSIATISLSTIQSLGVLEPKSSWGTVNNNYVTQGETAPVTSTDKNALPTTTALPLADSNS